MSQISNLWLEEVNILFRLRIKLNFFKSKKYKLDIQKIRYSILQNKFFSIPF